MSQKELEEKIQELKGKQSDIMKTKKADRDADALQQIRDQMNDLKKQASSLYKEKKSK